MEVVRVGLIVAAMLTMAACSQQASNENDEFNARLHKVEKLAASLQTLEEHNQKVLTDIDEELLGIKAETSSIHEKLVILGVEETWLADSDGVKHFKILRRVGRTVEVETPLGSLTYAVDHYPNSGTTYYLPQSLFFTGSDCTGTPVLPGASTNILHKTSESLGYFIPAGTPYDGFTALSIQSGDICSNLASAALSGFDISSLTPISIAPYDLTTPLSIVVEE